MNKNSIFKILVGLLFAAAIALGLLRSKQPSPEQRQLKSTGVSDGSLESYIKRGQELAKPQNTESKVTFLAVGDIMLSRNVAATIKTSKNINTPFGGMAYEFDKVDFAFGNLESPFSKKPIVGGHALIFGAATTTLQALADYKFKVLNLANNHALDQGLSGLNFTNSSLDYFAISHMGTGDNLDDAWQPAIISAKDDLQICFVGASYASVNDSGKTRNDYVARIEDLDRLKTVISNIKSSCDFIVATMHAGTEYTRTPNKAQTIFAHAAIDYGADMVIGAHPHWIQTIERYCPNSATISNPPSPILGEGAGGEVKPTCPNPKYIFYSLGNFIFDQEWSQETKEGLTLKITLSKPGMAPLPQNASGRTAANINDLQGQKIPATLKQIELLPVIIENYSTPRPATEEETKKILQKIGEKENILY